MSHFAGYIRLQNQVETNHLSARIKASFSIFQSDAEDCYQTDEAFIYQQFLHTTPESENQTRICQNERYVLAATCRLDNRADLMNKLALPADIDDHSYLLAAYTRWKDKCTEHLIGDFSFVVWDKLDQTLYLAKDHLGVKPLFYLVQNKVLYFSTTIPAIKALFDRPLTLNQTYIAKTLKVYPTDVDETFFADIIRLKPAHYAIYNKKGELSEKAYWNLRSIDLSAFKTHADLYEELNKLLVDAVQCRLRTNKPIACQLSGGLDSSALTVIASRLTDKNRLHTFSFVLNDETRAYSETKIDEQKTQNEIINYAGLNKENHHPIEKFHYVDVFHQLNVSNQIMGGYADSDSIWQDSLFKQAQKYHIGISISGFPGDECISCTGNNYYFDYMRPLKIKKLFAYIIENNWRGIKNVLNYFRGKVLQTSFIKYRNIQKGRNLLADTSDLNNTIKDKSFLFYPTFKEGMKNQICRPHTCLRSESEGLYASQYGIETVYPLADIRLVQFVYSLPAEMFKPTPMPRMLFRNICKGILPDAVRMQEKNNGALTLAYAEYWLKWQFEQFNNSEIENYLDMFNIQKYQKKQNDYKSTNTGLPPIILNHLAEMIKLNR